MDSILHLNDLETIIEYLKNKNIINKEAPFCLKCEKPLKWKKRSGSGDVFTWRCSTCDSTVSMRRKSLLEEF
jgi:tRNA(Ile2) C34 agmatinyltransferase TiaS